MTEGHYGNYYVLVKGQKRISGGRKGICLSTGKVEKMTKCRTKVLVRKGEKLSLER